MFGSKLSLPRLLSGAIFLSASLAMATDLDIDIDRRSGGDTIDSLIEDAVRQFAENSAKLTMKDRERLIRAGLYKRQIPFSLPTTVYLLRNGERPARNPLLDGGAPQLSIQVDPSFPTAYGQLLQDTFNQAKSTINAVFGQPLLGGNVIVKNFDVEISDRDAVAGGFYLPDNGSGQQEIRFPIYSNNEAAAVNFVHCLLLAYLGPSGYTTDALKEGLVRAATMRVVRTPGAMPVGLDSGLIESVLDNTYDVGTWYDVYNQRGLGGAKFIAPNLRDLPLPAGGSLGGVYLLRYQMAGTAWQKAIVEYPGLAAELNLRLSSNPGMASNIDQFLVQGQAAIDTLAGTSGATIEGLSFANWFRRQFILETRDTLGPKLICHPVPLPPVGGSSDFGVFDVVATWFETLSGGNEVLLSGTSYPIFWSNTFDRIFPSAQEDRMDIAGAYGSVAPNFPNLTDGQPYRVSVDIPVTDRLARVYLPAGGVATGANTTPNDFYGTVTGVTTNTQTRIRLTYGLTVLDNIPVRNGAFGFRVNTSGYLGAARCRVEVIRNNGGGDVVLIDRRVNKGPGPLNVDLRLDNGAVTFPFSLGLPKGLSTIGMPLEPTSSSIAEILNLNENEVLAARWNGAKARYDIAPDTGPFVQGHGYFVRMPATQIGFVLSGQTAAGVPISVALRPGWNLISNPLPEAVPTARVKVVRAADSPKAYSEAVGVEIGTTIFEFTPGPNDAATGAPESGTMTPATSFAPGKAYFVRVLAAEGATLVFEPTTIQTRPAVSTRINEAPRFVMKVQVERNGYRTFAEIGTSRSATSQFDPAFDSGLPPGMGGLQAWIEGNAAHRDIRSTDSQNIYRVRFDGLEKFKTYRFTTGVVSGQAPTYWIRRFGSSSWTRYKGAASFNFMAPDFPAYFDIRVEAGR